MKGMWSTAIVAAAVSAAVSAQSTDDMKTQAKSDKMSTTTYTGCVEAVNHGGTYLLTHIAGDIAAMRGDNAMHADQPMHDQAMHADKAMHDEHASMEKEHMPGHDMKMEGMSPNVVALAGSTNLKKHVGQKVTVAGSLSQGAMGSMRQDISTLTVSSLKVIAKSCS